MQLPYRDQSIRMVETERSAKVTISKVYRPRYIYIYLSNKLKRYLNLLGLSCCLHLHSREVYFLQLMLLILVSLSIGSAKSNTTVSSITTTSRHNRFTVTNNGLADLSDLVKTREAETGNKNRPFYDFFNRWSKGEGTVGFIRRFQVSI